MGNNNDKKSAGTLPDINFFLRDPLSDITPEDWEAAKPKILNPNLKMPIIFGTGDEEYSKSFREHLNWISSEENLKRHQSQCDEMDLEFWNRSRVENGKDLGAGISERFQTDEKIYGNITLEDIESISKGRRVGFDSMMCDVKLKDQTLEEAESKIWMPDFPRPKRGSNYTKPKNRKKKK